MCFGRLVVSQLFITVGWAEESKASLRDSAPSFGVRKPLLLVINSQENKRELTT